MDDVTVLVVVVLRVVVVLVDPFVVVDVSFVVFDCCIVVFVFRGDLEQNDYYLSPFQVIR